MKWSRLYTGNDPQRPSSRAGHGFISAGGQLYVYGGEAVGSESRGDFELNGGGRVGGLAKRRNRQSLRNAEH